MSPIANSEANAVFKDKKLQQHYDLCRKLGNDQTSEFFHKGVPRRGATHRVSYWNGRAGMPTLNYAKNTFGYAAWAAGRDDRKADMKMDNPMAAWTIRGNYLYPPANWTPVI